MCPAAAKTRFEITPIGLACRMVRERSSSYDDRVEETIGRLNAEFGPKGIDEDTGRPSSTSSVCWSITATRNWRKRSSPGFRQVMHRRHFHNDFIFVRPAISPEYIGIGSAELPVGYPNSAGFRARCASCSSTCWLGVPVC